MRRFFFLLILMVASLETKVVALEREKMIGQMMMVGFEGTHPSDPQVKQVHEAVSEGRVGGIILFRHNIKNKKQVKALIAYLKEAAPPDLPLLVAIDQEGGKVQRLSSKNGGRDYPSAQEISETYAPKEALKIYSGMAGELASLGFNLNFGPVVDFDHDPKTGEKCPVIGGLSRSYGATTQEIVDYARAFVEAHHQRGLLTALKHFPGHGLALKDSHQGLVDITKTWREFETDPYRELNASHHADMIMVGHLWLGHFDGGYPATLSEHIITPLLRDQLDFQGVVVTDDLHMGAIGQNYGLEEAALLAVQAGNDILLFSNNAAAAQGVKNFKGSVTIVDLIHDTLESAVQRGELNSARLAESFRRVKTLKERLL